MFNADYRQDNFRYNWKNIGLVILANFPYKHQMSQLVPCMRITQYTVYNSSASLFFLFTLSFGSTCISFESI